MLSVVGPHQEVTYRETVAPWFGTSLFFQPDIQAMAAASLDFQIHTLIGMALFMIWPFTRLVRLHRARSTTSSGPISSAPATPVHDRARHPARLGAGGDARPHI